MPSPTAASAYVEVRRPGSYSALTRGSHDTPWIFLRGEGPPTKAPHLAALRGGPLKTELSALCMALCSHGSRAVRAFETRDMAFRRAGPDLGFPGVFSGFLRFSFVFSGFSFVFFCFLRVFFCFLWVFFCFLLFKTIRKL